jgi:hypothetical protein
MAKSGDILEQTNQNLSELNAQINEFSNHQINMIENYDILLQNQLKTTDNHDIVVQNQKTIIKNQGIITFNQSAIINNQGLIVKNQAYLKTMIFTQAKIISLITKQPVEEVVLEVESFLQNTQSEISKGFEETIV